MVLRCIASGTARQAELTESNLDYAACLAGHLKLMFLMRPRYPVGGDGSRGARELA